MVTTRQGLIDYCLRELGEPVVEINVDDSQIEDRVDEALEYWRQYHWDGIEKVYLKQRVTASELYLSSSNAASFDLGDEVVGQTSGAKAKVCKETERESSGNMLLIRNVQGEFQVGETITSSNQSAMVSSVTLGSYDKKYFELPDLIYGVSRVIPFANASSSKNIFDLQYQLRLNDLYDLTSVSLIYYKSVMSHLALLDFELNGKPTFRFNRRAGKLHLDVNWESDIALGDFIIVECYRALDPAESVKVWDDTWLKHYTTALIKRQWASNGKKFQGLVLPGGISIDWDKIYAEAKDEIAELKESLQLQAGPLEFFMG
jgi:hypothetical protein